MAISGDLAVSKKAPGISRYRSLASSGTAPGSSKAFHIQKTRLNGQVSLCAEGAWPLLAMDWFGAWPSL